MSSPLSLQKVIVDTHAHLDFAEFDADRAQLFEQMRAQHIQSAIIPGVSPLHWQKQIQVATQYHCYFALGIHPWFCPPDIEVHMAALRTLLYRYKDEPRLVAVGECGLDKLRSDTWPLQASYLQQQIELANQFELPIILHIVKAHEEALGLFARYFPRYGGVVHGYTGSPELALRYVSLGFKLGIGGTVLNENAKKLHETVSVLPLDSFVLETDSPAMAPQRSVGKRNTPLIIGQIIDKVANLQKKSNVLISERLVSNAVQLFDL